MKLSTILKEVSEQQSRDMVTGIADILRDVKDEGNRKEIAKRMIKKFDREGVKYNAEEFLKLCGVENKMVREIGYTNKSGYGFPYTKTRSFTSYNLDDTHYEFDTGKNKYKVVLYKNPIEGPQKGWVMEVIFGIMDQEASHRVDFETEVNDPKNVYKVMATVINICKEDTARMEKEGKKITRYEFNPVKRKVEDPETGRKTEIPSDTGRANLYMAYLKKEFPGSTINYAKNSDKIWVDVE